MAAGTGRTRQAGGRGPHYRVVIYDVSGPRSTKVAESTGEAYHVAVGHAEVDRLVVYHSAAGRPDLLRDLAQIVADHPTGTES